MTKKAKVIVIGLDGGTWNIIKPLIDQGKLPTIKGVIKNGTYGELESSIPYITFPAWKCYSTGKNPGKLGVYGFFGIDLKQKKFIVNNSKSFKGKEIWDYLSDNDILCGVIGMPTTYPPKAINGFMISEFGTETGYTYPANLERELKNEFNYRLNLKYSFRVDRDQALNDCKELIKQRFESALYLFKKFNPVFLNLTIFYIDQIQHFGWKYMKENDPKYGMAIEDSWKLIDYKIKELLNCIDNNEDTYVVLMSDHGFTSYKKSFQISEWLVKKKYLLLNKSINILRLLNKIGINRDRIYYIVQKTRLLSIIRRFIPFKWQQKVWIIPEKDGGIDFTTKMDSLIDWNRSKVIIAPLCHGEIWLNENAFKSSKKKNLFKNQIIEELKNIRDPTNNEIIMEKICKSNQIYNITVKENAPDITMLPKEGYLVTSTIDINKKIWSDKSSSYWSAPHKLKGIFCISGPGIKKNKEISNAKIIDLAPTILHLFNIPIPNDIDGRVLTECFKEDSELAKREIVFQDVEKTEKLKDKIKRIKKAGKV